LRKKSALSFEKGMSKKGRQLCEEKSAPPDKILATPMFTTTFEVFVYMPFCMWSATLYVT